MIFEPFSGTISFQVPLAISAVISALIISFYRCPHSGSFIAYSYIVGSRIDIYRGLLLAPKQASAILILSSRSRLSILSVISTKLAREILFRQFSSSRLLSNSSALFLFSILTRRNDYIVDGSATLLSITFGVGRIILSTTFRSVYQLAYLGLYLDRYLSRFR